MPVGAIELVLVMVIVFDEQLVVLQVPSARTKYVVFNVGLTDRLVPDPIEVPPQLFEYQRHCAPEPKDPPATESVVEFPGQEIGFMLAIRFVAACDLELETVTVTNLQDVVLQVPSART